MRAGSIRPTLGRASTPQGPNLAWSSALASRLGPSGSIDFSGITDLCIQKILDCQAFKARVVQANCSKRLAGQEVRSTPECEPHAWSRPFCYMMQLSPTVSSDQAAHPLLRLFCAAVRKLFSPAGVQRVQGADVRAQKRGLYMLESSGGRSVHIVDDDELGVDHPHSGTSNPVEMLAPALVDGR